MSMKKMSANCHISEERLYFANASRNHFYDSVSTVSNTKDVADVTEQMRARLKWHYMNAYQKYKAGGRKPWKLLVQIIKIFLVTAQVIFKKFHRFCVSYLAVMILLKPYNRTKLLYGPKLNCKISSLFYTVRL